MPLHTIEPRRLYRQIADQLRALIDAGEIASGARLPPERDLALQLGVSRPSVREALIALEIEGRIEVRMGSGIYVRPEPSAPGAAGTTAARSGAGSEVGEGPLETIRARQLIEAELAALAAARMQADQIGRLGDALALMRRAVALGQLPTAADREFHLCIAQAADNSVLLRLVTELFDERHTPLFRQLGQHFETAQSWARALDEHQAVFDAIAAGSATRARRAMRTHLVNSHDRYTAGWPSEAPARAALPPPRAIATPRAIA